MKEFVLKHPYLTALFIVPSIVGGAVTITKAVLGAVGPATAEKKA